MLEAHVGHTPGGNYTIWCPVCQKFWGDYTSKLPLGKLFEAAKAHQELFHDKEKAS